MSHLNYCNSLLSPYFHSCPHYSVFIGLYNLKLFNGSHFSQSKIQNPYNGLEVPPPTLSSHFSNLNSFSPRPFLSGHTHHQDLTTLGIHQALFSLRPFVGYSLYRESSSSRYINGSFTLLQVSVQTSPSQ